MSGGGGTWRDGEPDNATNGFLHAWGGGAGTHFLMVTTDGSTMSVEPTTAGGRPLPLLDRHAQSVASPLVVTV